MTTTSTPTYSQIRSLLQPGDVILFEADGDIVDLGIGILDSMKGDLPFTHCGIVYRFPGSDPNDAPMIWQAAPPPMPPESAGGEAFGQDFIKLVPTDGCQLVSLDVVIALCAEQTSANYQFAYRNIQSVSNPDLGLDSELLTLLDNFIRFTDGRSFSYPPEDGMGIDYFEGYKEQKQTGNDTYFCSKLASDTYKNIGLLSSDVITNAVLPGDFAGDNLAIQNNYQLGPLTYFTADPTN
jgi:hypothetical protein